MNIWMLIDLVVRKKMQENIWPGDCFPATEVLESTTGLLVPTGEMETAVMRFTEPINNQSSCVINMQLLQAGVCVLIKGTCTECFNKTC